MTDLDPELDVLALADLGTGAPDTDTPPSWGVGGSE